jgi:hypothetical protein
MSLQKISPLMVLFILSATVLLASTPPGLVNYQGILRDNSDQPLSGTFDMVFYFYDAPSGGSLLLTDAHFAGGAVNVINGLFDVALGSGSIIPGAESTLAAVFQNHEPVYVEIEIASETLSPRVRLITSGYSLNSASLNGLSSGNASGNIPINNGVLNANLNADLLDGLDSTDFINGSGGANFLPKFTSNNTIGNSIISEDSGQILISTAVPSSPLLLVDGSGLFQNTNGSEFGINAEGNLGGGLFVDIDDGSYAQLAYGDYGVYGTGKISGGSFQNIDGTSNALVGTLGTGINSYGDDYGGFFSSISYAVVGLAPVGGGIFTDTDSSGMAFVGFDTYKIQGNGSVAFVQNHPIEKDKVIVYNAPESDEVATYNRGTARLVDGVAHVSLGDTFAWVTNPDFGLTAYVTPRGEWSDLYVENVSPTELVVRSKDGTGNGVFDYIVYGLRIGFEEVSIVQEKKQDSPIPSMASHRTAYQKHPELQQYNAFEHFNKMRSSLGETQPVDLSASIALKNAIHEFDPATDKIKTVNFPKAADLENMSKPAAPVEVLTKTSSAQPNVKPVQRPSTTQSQSDAEGNFYATSFRSASDELAKSMPVVQQVTLGDVVVVDRVNHGWLKLADMPADPGVVGVISAAPGVLLGAEKDSAKAPVALSGIVKCKVDANHGAIQVGDLLTTSSTPGYAMRAERAAPGTIIGKALEPLDAGTGLIEILIMHQ